MPQQCECVVRFVFSLLTQVALALKFRLIAYKFARRTITVSFFLCCRSLAQSVINLTIVCKAVLTEFILVDLAFAPVLQQAVCSCWDLVVETCRARRLMAQFSSRNVWLNRV